MYLSIWSVRVSARKARRVVKDIVRSQQNRADVFTFCTIIIARSGPCQQIRTKDFRAALEIVRRGDRNVSGPSNLPKRFASPGSHMHRHRLPSFHHVLYSFFIPLIMLLTTTLYPFYFIAVTSAASRLGRRGGYDYALVQHSKSTRRS